MDRIPLRSNAGHAAHPQLIPRDFLGSKTASSRSPTLPTFPTARPDAQQVRKEADVQQARAPMAAPTNSGRQSTGKTTRGAPEDINVSKTRSGEPPDTDGTTSSITDQSASQLAAANMPRTSSIDSAISSLSNNAAAQKLNDAKEPSIAEIRNLIATAGSAENLVQHLLRDKANAASQNAQLWKLVDKQRTLLLGLNKDLERVSKERDRYRKKAKELTVVQNTQPIDRHVSQSHSPPRTPPSDELPIQMTEPSEAQDNRSQSASSRGPRSPTEVGMMPSPLHTNIAQHATSRGPGTQRTLSKPQAPALATDLAVPQFSVTDATPITASPVSFSAKRQIAPKPLDLRSSKEDTAIAALAAEQAVSDSESNEPHNHERGRRKTREQDDRDRELMAMQQLQQEDARDRSTKDKRPALSSSNSASTLLPAADFTTLPRAAERDSEDSVGPPQILVVNEGNMLSPPLRSPGLPASPRPMQGERLASPEAQSSLNSLPMSPRNGGFPLSPRAPKAAIPMPAGTQIVISEPPAASATTPQRTESLNAAVSGPHLTVSGDVHSVNRSLIDPQFPDLLLPPNALPSIQIRVASSRLKPSRFSMLGLKPQEDTSVFTLAIISRSNSRELWRIEKVPGAMPHLDQQIRPRCPEAPKLPDRKLFAGHSPATLDARRSAIDQYFDELLDTHIDEQSAIIICRFLSSDVLDSTAEPPTSSKAQESLVKASPGGHRRDGYLTKKGKNFGGWKSRYFVLDSTDFRYFEAPGGAHLGTIKLLNARIGRQTSNDATSPEDPESEGQYRHAFLILEPKRKDSNSYVRHVLCAENDTERDEWVASLLHYIEDPSRPATSGGDASANPRALLRNAGHPDAHSDSNKASSPTLGPANSGSDSPTSSVTPPLDSGVYDNHGRSAPGATLGIPGNPRSGNRQSAMGQPQSKIRNFFRKSSHEPLNEQRSPYPPPSAKARGGYVRPVFGLSLVEAVEYCPPEDVDVQLPAVVYRCIEYLRGKKAANEEGLFRLSGSNIVIRNLKERFNTEGDVDLLGDEECYDVHAVASLFKSYLRELPATILTRDLHPQFLKVLELTSKQEKISAFNVLVHRLPGVNFVLLRALSEYLLEVVQNQDRNKMTVKNVGIVFAPTLNIPAPVFSMFLTDFAAIFQQNPTQDEPAYASVSPDEQHQSAARSPHQQTFADSAASNHNAFAQNATLQAQTRPAYEQQLSHPGLDRSQSYERGGYVSDPQQHAPPQPMYPPPPQPLPPNPQQQQQYGGYRVVEPDSNIASAKQKRRESAMIGLF
ncbi:GTPase-activating protein BEM3 [Cyphellophora attinorum]|uniref:GTPase-activating protein BEM3 n=1 Tax=Cyphellophora attinorum TaxID=1664694 RepID=A0A0N1P1Y3_9EURO|nr:GTPase-activating protein BEM3 [Phialophora attinorum]KPI45952.1 GTPase-activating protein BEM3 [Phialophora attinorum]